MSNVVTSLTFLKDLPLYAIEKPYFVTLAQQGEKDENSHKISNLQFEEISGIEILDLKKQHAEFLLETSGFQLVSFKSAHIPVDNIDQVEAYRAETEEYLRAKFEALDVICWEIRVSACSPARLD